MPPNFTPEQTAILHERMRLARDARIQQLQQSQSQNLFPGQQNGVPPNQTNGFNPFSGMMNGMSSSPPNHNFRGNSE
jgi:hypothetical protein